MAIASGTCGTCQWTIADDGKMTIGAGTIHAPWLTGIMNCNWPWGDHVKEITSCTIATGVVVGKQESLMGGYVDDYVLSNMFYGCSNMRSLVFQGTFDTSNVTNMSSMLYGCSSLASLDLSAFNTTKVKDMSIMLMECSMLTSVRFGASFDTSALEGSSGTSFVSYEFPSASNSTNGIIVNSDAAFRALTKAQHAGTWSRSASGVTFKVTAIRTEAGQADEDGEDVTISVTWVTGAATTTRNISVYKKLSSATAYPSTPAATRTLSGGSGTTEITIENIGDDAYDFRVEFYDGTNTYIAFPSVASNIRLVTIDPNGIPSCHNARGDFGTIFELIYPVGAIYMSTNNISPQVLFGGTWEQIQNRFLLAAGSSYSAGSTGGSADASLPAHTHTVSGTAASNGAHTHSVSGTAASNGAHTHGMGNIWSDGSGSSSAYTMSSNRKLKTRNTGSSGAHTHTVSGTAASNGAHTHTVSGTAASNGVSATGKNMPPYLTVYMWKRTA